MTPQASRHTRYKRAGHEKSRNGCLTCKIRRVKCDETKPECRRCIETGRKCEGPVLPQICFVAHDGPRKQATSAAPGAEISNLVPQHSEFGRRAFHYFTHTAAPVYAGAVDSGFWQNLLPRLAQTYDFVWDAVACLSHFFEHREYQVLRRKPGQRSLAEFITDEHRQALISYNRAIVKVRQLVEHGQLDESLIALSCILFASVEHQQQNADVGAELVRKTFSILTKTLATPHSQQNFMTGGAIHQVVAPFVLRKAVLTETLGSFTAPCLLQTDKGASSSMLCEATTQFAGLVNDCYELIRVADFVPHIADDKPVKISFLSSHKMLLEKLIQWKASFNITEDQKTDPGADLIRSYMLMYWAVSYVSLATCISAPQTIFDEHMDHFADIVDHATSFLRYMCQTMQIQHPPCNFNPGVTPALYFCATKCRDPLLRREALQLMRQHRQQESIWTFVDLDRVAAKVIAVEEGEDSVCFSEDAGKSQRQSMPPEERRVASVSPVLRPAVGGRQRRALEMNRIEFAPDGSKKLINEYVWLDEDDEEV